MGVSGVQGWVRLGEFGILIVEGSGIYGAWRMQHFRIGKP